MSTNIRIDYAPTKGKFIIEAPPWENGRIRDIPSRTFNQGSKTWSVPGTRVNAAYMEMTLKGANWTKLALDKLAEIRNSVTNLIAPALPFPSYYVFKTEPMKHQRTALERAFGRTSFAYFMDMGTGKSKTYIDLAGASRMHGLIETVIMVCPVALRKNWIRELEIHCPLPYDVHILNTDDQKGYAAWLEKKHDFKWLIVGVESLGISERPYNMMLDFIRRYPRTMMGVDESSKIKNHAALRSKRCQAAARHVPYRVVMTGTPIAKGVMDLYGHFEFLDPDILGVGDFYSFRNRYAVFGGYENKAVVGYQNMNELMDVIAPFVYQVRKEEALPDLPPKIRTLRYVPMSREQTVHYKTMARDKRMVHEDGRDKVVDNALEKALRLRQITSNLMALQDVDEDVVSGRREVRTEQISKVNPKIADLLDFLEEFDGRMIVWCAFRPEVQAVTEALRKKFGDNEVVELHGGISEEQRDINVNELFQKGKARFVVGMAVVGGMGLTMTMADCEFYMSNTHSFIDREQSEDRAHRKGRKGSVLYVDQIAQIDIGKGVMMDTIDMLVYQSNVNKKDLSEYIRGEIARLEAEGYKDLSRLFGLVD